MADNVAITPGSGAKAASREVSYSGETAQLQVVALATVSGSDDAKAVADVDASNPLPVAVTYGELLDAIEALRFAVQALTTSIGMALPGAAGWPIMEARQATAANLNATVTGTVTSNIGSGTLSALTTLTNQSQMGGFATNDYMVALMHLQADGLRRNISVT